MSQDSLGAGEVREETYVNPHRWLMPAVSISAGLVAAVIAVVAVYLLAQDADVDDRLLALGYPGVSVIMFFSSATVFLPAPGIGAVLWASGPAQLNPFVLGIFAAMGSSVGELTGYLVGLGGYKALHQTHARWIRPCEFFMRRWGFLTILVMASFPNPFFDAVGILAGGLGYPARRLWVACMIGNTVKYSALALLAGNAMTLFPG